MKVSKGRGYSKYRGSHVERNRRAARPAAHEHRSNQEEKGFLLSKLCILSPISRADLRILYVCWADVPGIRPREKRRCLDLQHHDDHFLHRRRHRRSNRKAYRTQDNAFRFRCAFLRWIRRNRHVCKWIDRVGLRFLRRPRRTRRRHRLQLHHRDHQCLVS